MVGHAVGHGIRMPVPTDRVGALTRMENIVPSGSASGHDSIRFIAVSWLPCAFAVWVVRVMVRSRVRGYSRARPRGSQPLAAPTLGPVPPQN